jgi:hypothetical protein
MPLFNPALKPGRDSRFKSRLNQSISPQISVAAWCLCAPITVVYFFSCHVVCVFYNTINVGRAAGNVFCAAFFDMVDFDAETFPVATGFRDRL